MVAAMAKPASTLTGEEQWRIRGGGDDEDAQHAGDGAGRHDRLRFARGRAGVCLRHFSDLGVSQPTVSHHLKKLREAGLLTSERRGTWVYCRVEPSVLAAMG